MNFAKRRRSVAETTWLFVLRNSQKTGLHESSPSPLFLSIKFLTTGHPPRPLSTATQRRCTKVLYRWIGTLSGCGPPEISDCRVQPRSGRSLGDIVSVLSRVGRRSRAPLSCVLVARSRVDLGPLRLGPVCRSRHSGRFSSLAKLRSPWPLRRLAPAPAPCEVPRAVRRRMPSKLLASRLLPVRGVRPQLHVSRARPGHGPHAAASSPQAHPRALNEPRCSHAQSRGSFTLWGWQTVVDGDRGAYVGAMVGACTVLRSDTQHHVSIEFEGDQQLRHARERARHARELE